MKVTFSGFGELSDALREMKKSTTRGVLKRALTKAAQPVLQSAIAKAPHDTGNLRDHIVISDKLGANARRKARKAKGEEAAVTVYVGTRNFNAWPLEFGSSRAPAQPFLRPAWDGSRGAVESSIANDVRTEVEKTAARAAKRRKAK